MIVIKDLYKAFGPNKVLKGIDISFQNSGIYAILGPNSSGKTTLMKSILGLVRPQEGSITLDGDEVRGNFAYRQKIGYLPQIARFPENLTVRELLAMIKDFRSGRAHDQRLIDLFELNPFLDSRLGTLSGGTRQKVNIVQAFMYDSPYIFLDEPTAGLDPVSTIKFKSLLKECRQAGKMVLITTHIMSLVEELADELVFLLEGKIHYFGTPQKLKSKYEAERLEEAIASMINGNVPIHGITAPGHRLSDDANIELKSQNR